MWIVVGLLALPLVEIGLFVTTKPQKASSRLLWFPKIHLMLFNVLYKSLNTRATFIFTFIKNYMAGDTSFDVR